MAAATAASSSSSSRLAAKARPALVQWTCEKQSSPSVLSDLTFDLYYEPDSGTAFFKLRAKVTLKDSSSSVPTSVYLFIPPDRIQSVTVTEPDDFPSEERSQSNINSLGPETVRLCFVLKRRAMLVLPRSCRAKNQKSGRILDSLRSIRESYRFAVFAKFPTRLAPRVLLRSLCSAASKSGALTSTPEQNVTSTLYAGEGGEVVQDGVDEAGKCEENDLYTESLPSYDELVSTSPSRKRQRSDSDKTPDVRRLSELGQLMHRIEEHLVHRVEQQDTELKRLGKLVVEQAEEITRLTQRVESQEEEKASLLARIEGLADRLDVCEVQIEEEVDSKWDAARDDVLDSVRDELRQWISDRLQPSP